jgi:hypothetical protein
MGHISYIHNRDCRVSQKPSKGLQMCSLHLCLTPQACTHKRSRILFEHTYHHIEALICWKMARLYPMELINHNWHCCKWGIWFTRSLTTSVMVFPCVPYCFKSSTDLLASNLLYNLCITIKKNWPPKILVCCWDPPPHPVWNWSRVPLARLVCFHHM